MHLMNSYIYSGHTVLIEHRMTKIKSFNAQSETKTSTSKQFCCNNFFTIIFAKFSSFMIINDCI